MELELNRGFLPRLVLAVQEYENEGKSTTKIFDEVHGHCFYTGVVAGDEGSAVAVSLCDGMVNIVKSCYII